MKKLHMWLLVFLLSAPLAAWAGESKVDQLRVESAFSQTATGQTQGTNDAYVKGQLEVDGACRFDATATFTNGLVAAGALDLNNTVDIAGALTLSGGQVNVFKGGDIASPAGGVLTLTAGTFFDITGTNSITSIAAASSTAGRLLILQFDGILTFTDGGNLKIAGDLVTSADDTITLICDGTNWWEISRSVN